MTNLDQQDTLPTDPEAATLVEVNERAQNYSSPAIRARRSRILEETRKSIAENGISALSMNEVGKRAGVAKRTLYNAFQTRERMIAVAIQEYFDEYVRRIQYTNPAGTLMNNVERMISVISRNRKIRNYIRAIMALYFSPEADPDIWQTMHGMATRSNLEWVRSLQAGKQLQSWVSAERLVDDLVRLEYATINAWAQGRLTDDEIIPHLLQNYLTFVAGATRGAARKEIENLLREINDHGVSRLLSIKPRMANS
jgi:AcrR family transcriptional regulator